MENDPPEGAHQPVHAFPAPFLAAIRRSRHSSARCSPVPPHSDGMINWLIGFERRADLSDFYYCGCGVCFKGAGCSLAQREFSGWILQENPSTAPEAVVFYSIHHPTTEAVELSLAKGTSAQRTCLRCDANG